MLGSCSEQPVAYVMAASATAPNGDSLYQVDTDEPFDGKANAAVHCIHTAQHPLPFKCGEKVAMVLDTATNTLVLDPAGDNGFHPGFVCEDYAGKFCNKTR